jgi:uracil-DNA glycosylase
MNPKLINPFVQALATATTLANVANPYQNPVACSNLRIYLKAICSNRQYSGVLLVGEAPGQKGCALTGIPFTSERILNVSTHPFINGTNGWKTKSSTTEASATIVWGHFQNLKNLPALWNIFPFHPHTQSGGNRTPNKSEILTNAHFFNMLLQILCPKTVIAVGKTAAKHIPLVLTSTAFSQVPSVRHPSFGGKSDFIKGLKRLGIR